MTTFNFKGLFDVN